MDNDDDCHLTLTCQRARNLSQHKKCNGLCYYSPDDFWPGPCMCLCHPELSTSS